LNSSTDVPVGRVGRPHGIRGEVLVLPLTDAPDRFAPGAVLGVEGDPDRSLEVAASRDHSGRLVVGFVGYRDRNAAERLRDLVLTIPQEDRRPLDEGEFWPEELVGMTGLDPDGNRIGTITAVVLAEAQDRIVVTADDGRTAEVPFVDELVGEVHPSGGFLVLRLPDGLL
jgi:16S rRNA processing protein RimM